MIPLKLELKNFLSYGSETQTIDFTQHQLICLSGKNGHGKSALLDAITWALWSQARKTSGNAKADAGLLRLGQTQMMVSLDFICGGSTYRVRREYAKTYGKPYAALDFALLDPNDNSFASLTDKTIRTTQAKIEKIIGLDYETFINSAFLRQGKANEFSQKSPKERKEILGTILGLDRFERLRKRASEQVRQAQTEAKHAQKLIEHLETDCSQAGEIRAQLRTTQGELKTCTQQEQKLEVAGQQLTQKREKLNKQTREKELLIARSTDTKNQYEQLMTQLQAARTAWRAIHKQSLEIPDPEILRQAKKQLEHTFAKQQQTLRAQLVLKEQVLRSKEQIQHLELALTEKHRKGQHSLQLEVEKLSLAHQTLDEQCTRLAKDVATLKKEEQSLQKEHITLGQALKRHTNMQKTQGQENIQFDKRRTHYQQYLAQINAITDELTGLDRKRRLSDTTNNPSCPLCEQNLSGSRKRFLQTKFVQQEQVLKHRLERLKRLTARLKQLLLEQHTRLQKQQETKEETARIQTQYEHTHTQQALISQKHQAFTQDLDNLKKERSQLHERKLRAHKQLKSLTTEHNYARDTDPHLTKQTKRLSELERQLGMQQIDARTHEQCAQRIRQIEKQLASIDEQHQQQKDQIAQEQRIRHLCDQLRKLKHQRATFEEQLKKHASVDTQQQDLIQRQHTHEQDCKKLATHKEALMQERGKLENQVAQCDKQQKALAQHRTQLKVLKHTTEQYQALTNAFGKDGIQALLIEEVIPEIEQEANELLGRLTDNQAQLFIESLRDLKKGGSRETLDITISDCMGIRPYEMFSGGEAFRIDFALRIAISKLLARRSGTALQTLIIDEGFGSQDEEGLAHMMEAIHKIQDDFVKVIVVSHLPAMKNQFPVHFFVEKGASGSTVQVLQHG